MFNCKSFEWSEDDKNSNTTFTGFHPKNAKIVDVDVAYHRKHVFYDIWLE